MANDQLNVLILCYDFPPLPSISAQRPQSWLDYFHENDLYPIVITRKWSKGIRDDKDYFQSDTGDREIVQTETGTLIRVPFRFKLKTKLYNSQSPFSRILRKSITLFETLTKWKWKKNDAKYAIFEETDTYLKQNKVDLILATGEPFILFEYARQLGKKYDVPFAVDYRDGWFTDHNPVTGLQAKIRQREFKKEKRVLDEALFYSAASPEIVQMNDDAFGFKGKGYDHPNGINLGKITAAQKNAGSPPQDTLTVCFAGTIYPRHNVKDFTDACIELSREGIALKTRFIGIELKPSETTQIAINAANEYRDLFEVVPPVSHERAIQYQFESHVLLKFDFTGQMKGMLGAKLYEYAATRNPILTVLSIEDKRTPFFPNRSVQFMTSNKEEVKAVLRNLYVKFKAGEPIKNDLSEEEVYSLSREKSIAAFANELRQRLSNQ